MTQDASIIEQTPGARRFFGDVGPKRIGLAVLIGVVALGLMAWLVTDLGPLVEHWDVALMMFGIPALILIKRFRKTHIAVRELEVLLPEHMKKGPASYRQLVKHFEEYTPQELSMATKHLESKGMLARRGPCLCLPGEVS